MDSEKAQRPKNGGRATESRRTVSAMRLVLLGFKTRMDDALRPHGVTAAQWRFLLEVRARPGATGAQLARACHITPQSAQAMMARAVERGWVVRGKDRENERLVTARLTAAGERVLERADGMMRELEGKIFGRLTVTELREMNATLTRVLETVEDEAGSIQ